MFRVNYQKILIFFAILGAICTTYYIFNYGIIFHSDSATANLLAREQLKERSFFPENWIYAQDIWIVFINNLIMPLSFLVKNQILLRSITIFIQSVALISLIYYFCKRFISSDTSFLVISIILSGVSTLFLEMVFGQGPYGNTALWEFSSILLFSMLLMSNNKKKNNIISTIFLIMLVILNSMGSRYLLTLNVPLISIIIYLYLFTEQNKKKLLRLLVINCFSIVIGLIFFRMIRGYVNFSVGNANLSFVSMEQVIENIKSYIFGYMDVYGALAPNGHKMISLLGIFVAYRFILFLVFYLLPIIKWRFYINHNNIVVRIVYIFYISSFIANSFIFIFGSVSVNMSSIRYFIPVMFIGIVLFSVFFFEVIGKVSNKLKIVCFISIIPFFISSYVFHNMTNFIEYDNGSIVLKENQTEKLIHFLEDNNLEFGFATYWNSGVVSVLSDFQNEIAAINIVDGSIEPFLWLSSKRWYKPEYHEGKTFLMLDDSELSQLDTQKLKSAIGDPIEMKKFNNYNILVYSYNIATKLDGFIKIN